MRYLSIAVLSLMFSAPGAHAQSSPEAEQFTWGEIFDADEGVLFGSAVLGTAALGRFDAVIMESVQDPAGVRSFSMLQPIANRLDIIGRPGSFFLVGGTFLVGRAVGMETLGDIGMHAAGALLITELATRGIKGVVGRSRPHLSEGPSDFNLGGGFNRNEISSFPSGHASTAFTTAAVVQSELSLRGSPWAVPVGLVLYGTASAVSLARVYQNEHWITDVFAGAVLGYLVGENVVEYAYRNEGRNTPSSTGRVSQSQISPIPIFSLSMPLP